MLLLNCLNNCLIGQTLRNYNNSSTGEIIIIDTNTVVLPVSTIKTINARLIEREYLLTTVSLKDSIISSYKRYSDEQSNIINDLQNRIVDSNNKFNNVNNSLIRTRKENSRLKWGIGGSIGLIILTILIK